MRDDETAGHDETRDADPGRGPLRFEDEPGAARSKWVAGLMVLVLAGWMGSGFLLPAPPEETSQTAEVEAQLVAVAVRESRAQAVPRIFAAEGQAQPDRQTALRAEVSGQIAEVLVDKGAMLDDGQLVARFDASDLEAQVAQAEAEVDRADREFRNAESLRDRGIATEDRVSQARATLAAAEAQLTRARTQLEDAEIRAPFAGRLNELSIDAGEFVSAGTEVGRVLDRDPLTVVIQIPQQALSRVAEGQAARIRFITGEERDGTVVFLGENADAETRTFRAEIEVANPDSALPSGLSAQVRIPTGEVEAHFISPAVLSLGPTGELGVKTLDAEDAVVFNPVAIERAQTDGIWVSGLPATARIITIGQGFVSAGETVDPRPEEDSGLPERSTGAVPAPVSDALPDDALPDSVAEPSE